MTSLSASSSRQWTCGHSCWPATLISSSTWGKWGWTGNARWSPNVRTKGRSWCRPGLSSLRSGSYLKCPSRPALGTRWSTSSTPMGFQVTCSWLCWIGWSPCCRPGSSIFAFWPSLWGIGGSNCYPTGMPQQGTSKLVHSLWESSIHGWGRAPCLPNWDPGLVPSSRIQWGMEICLSG